MKEVPSEIKESQALADDYREKQKKYSRELDAEKQRFMETKAQVEDLDPRELLAARMAVRPTKEQEAMRTIQRAMQREIYPQEKDNVTQDVDRILNEEFLELRYRAEQRYVLHDRKTQTLEWER